MSGKKGMRHYPVAFRQQVRAEHEKGETQSLLAKKYGVSMYSVENRNLKTVLHVMRKYGLLSEVRRKRWQGCGQSVHRYANILNRNFKTEQPNKKRGTDISYIPTAGIPENLV